MYDPYKALYVHIPFCKTRCAYCDFATKAIDPHNAEIRQYIEDLIIEIRRASKEEKLGKIETVYIGGGTPSFIGSAHLSSLLYALSMSMHLTADVECSMEANPESITQELIKDVWALGVNRLSIGVQSFNNDLLHFLKRAHSGDDAQKAIQIAQQRFDNVSIDLMCGIPGQSFEDFKESLEIALEMGVKHVSIYPLVIEEGTPLDQKLEVGEIKESDQDMQALMMQMAASILEPAGLMRYEVASYALAGYECKHNITYWTGRPYIGFGESAVTMTQNSSRRMRIQDGEIIESLNRRQMLAEDLMMKMRMTEGVSDRQVKEASLLLPDTITTFWELTNLGFVTHEEGRYKPTLVGWLCGNELYGKVYNLAP